MAQLRRSSASVLGVNPTNSQKLIYISQKLGLSGIASMQGTSFNIYDTQPLTTGTGRQILNFFTATSNRSRSFSNLQAGTLQAGEAMIVEELSFLLLTLSGPDLNSDSTAIVSATPITMVPTTVIGNRASVTLGLINMTIANSRIVKDYLAYEQDPSWNPRTTGVATLDTATATNVRHGESKVYLEAPSVLPPNQKINVALEVGVTGTVAANTAIMCVAGRFGSIYASKTTL